MKGVAREQNPGTRPTSPQTVPRLAAMTAARPIPSAVQRSLSGVKSPTHSSVAASPDFAALVNSGSIPCMGSWTIAGPVLNNNNSRLDEQLKNVEDFGEH